MEVKHLDIKISGRVQGVGFRWEARSLAKKLNLFGFVRNLPGSRVYIEAEGDEESLEKFLTWCRKGPWLSKVENVEVEKAESKGYNDFEIKL